MRTKRTLLALVALGYLPLLVEAWVGHLHSSAGEISQRPQYLPLLFAPLALLALGTIAALGRSEPALAWVTRIVGGLSACLGIAGIGFHLGALLKELSRQQLSFGGVMDAMGSGPPLLAPGAFTAIGLLVIAVGARRVRIAIEHPPAVSEAEASRPAPQPEVGERAA